MQESTVSVSGMALRRFNIPYYYLYIIKYHNFRRVRHAWRQDLLIVDQRARTLPLFSQVITSPYTRSKQNQCAAAC